MRSSTDNADAANKFPKRDHHLLRARHLKPPPLTMSNSASARNGDPAAPLPAALVDRGQRRRHNATMKTRRRLYFFRRGYFCGV
jgi:hypothetical protein